MTPRQVRSSLKGPLAPLGFREAGSRFVGAAEEVEHQVEVTAVRRLQGCIEIHHRVSTLDEPRLSVAQEVVSHGLGTEYPRIWSAAAVDAALVLQQVSAVCRVFRTRADLAHFLSEDGTPGAKAGTWSASEAALVLERLARQILGHEFSRVPGFQDFGLWFSNAETEGYRHLAYLEANGTRTLANVVVLALPSNAVAGGFRSDSSLRLLMTAPKAVLYSGGRPVLVSMHADDAVDTAGVRSALLQHLAAHPPHRLPR